MYSLLNNNIFSISIGTTLSKFIGFLRQILIAALFGVGLAYDAYNYAYIIPGFLIIIIGGINGPLHNAVVAVLTPLEENRASQILQNISLKIILLLLLISLLIFLKDGFPIVIKQNRVGLHGDQFDMLKFRTMKNKSHELREELSELNKGQGPLFKIENDPRILNGLSFIREMSLDEIPQLINVLKGEMSIVGPRPLFDDDTELFDTKYMRRLNVMPGITGLLQINERNAIDFETWYKYDIEYIENWSLFMDLEIIFKTPFAMFSKKIRGI